MSEAGEGCGVAAFDRSALAEEGNVSADRVKSFAVVCADEGGGLQRIVEKPEAPEQFVRDGKLWVNMNLYRFTPRIFEFCRSLEPDPERGELELTSAVNAMVAEGGSEFHVHRCSGGVLDLTSRDDIPSLQEALERVEPAFPSLR
jgi:dTDP-glucose pyrophosphorylase